MERKGVTSCFPTHCSLRKPTRVTNPNAVSLTRNGNLPQNNIILRFNEMFFVSSSSLPSHYHRHHPTMRKNLMLKMNHHHHHRYLIYYQNWSSHYLKTSLNLNQNQMNQTNHQMRMINRYQNRYRYRCYSSSFLIYFLNVIPIFVFEFVWKKKREKVKNWSLFSGEGFDYVFEGIQSF